jgi:hypothetical protein
MGKHAAWAFNAWNNRPRPLRRPRAKRGSDHAIGGLASGESDVGGIFDIADAVARMTPTEQADFARFYARLERDRAARLAEEDLRIVQHRSLRAQRAAVVVSVLSLLISIGTLGVQLWASSSPGS